MHSFNVRVALGALIIKERLQLSAEEAVLQIEDNPYLQYFLSFPEYQPTRPFDPSIYVHFGKRLGEDVLARYNELIIKTALAESREAESDDDNAHPLKNKGKLPIDATCAPADIAYPTDLRLLNEARERPKPLSMNSIRRSQEKKPSLARTEFGLASSTWPPQKRSRLAARRVAKRSASSWAMCAGISRPLTILPPTTS